MLVGEIEIVPLLDAVGELAELGEAYPGVPAESCAELVEELVDADCLLVCGHFPGSGIGSGSGIGRFVTRDGRVVREETA